jgi:DtxR family Mn-dependent transcriptional regulator
MFYYDNIKREATPMSEELSATMEDYLETIFRIEEQKHFARVRDISAALEVAKSAATSALQRLSEKGLVNYEPYEPVTLSAEGRQRAGRIVLRHRVIEDFLESVLGLEAGRANSIACGMEHAIDRDALDRFVCFLAFVGRRRAGGESWLEEFRRFIREGTAEETCEECMQQYLEGAGIQAPGEDH